MMRFLFAASAMLAVGAYSVMTWIIVAAGGDQLPLSQLTWKSRDKAFFAAAALVATITTTLIVAHLILVRREATSQEHTVS